MGRQVVTEEEARKAREKRMAYILSEVRAAIIDYIGRKGPIGYADQIMPTIEKRLRGE